jgi:KDO2-lipid IV(A) lauroyltransferase
MLSNFLYLLVYKIFGYRQNVVRANLTNSFPKKTLPEIIAIEKLFYANLCDWVVETIKMFTITKEELLKRNKLVNLDLWDKVNATNRHIIMAAGHFNNFEWGAQAITLNSKHQVVGIYTPLSNKYFNNFILKNRKRFGAKTFSNKEIGDYIKNIPEISAIGMVADQCPRKESKLFWTTFLNQETAVFTGVERYATMLNAIVLYVYPFKIKRGYYEIRAAYISDEPTLAHPYAITQSQTNFLEQLIDQQPEAWLWSHKRWKLKRSK